MDGISLPTGWKTLALALALALALRQKKQIPVVSS
jgi:hypothetical protein